MKNRKKASKNRIIDVPEQCPECGSSNIVYDPVSGEYVCASCGLVLAERIFEVTPEWRAFSEEDRIKLSRVGEPLPIDRTSLTTVIGEPGRKLLSRKIPPSERKDVSRMIIWHKRAQYASSAERNLALASSELDIIGNKLKLPTSLKERTLFLYRKVIEKGLTRGRSVKELIAATLYAACRLENEPYTINDIAKAVGRSSKRIGKLYRLVVSELKIAPPKRDAKRFLSTVTGKVSVIKNLRPSEIARIQREAYRILEQADKLHLTRGKDPMGMAAAAIVLACERLGIEGPSFKELAKSVGKTEITIKNRYKDLKEKI